VLALGLHASEQRQGFLPLRQLDERGVRGYRGWCVALLFWAGYDRSGIRERWQFPLDDSIYFVGPKRLTKPSQSTELAILSSHILAASLKAVLWPKYEGW
jgi:hypothetical protein